MHGSESEVLPVIGDIDRNNWELTLETRALDSGALITNF